MAALFARHQPLLTMKARAGNIFDSTSCPGIDTPTTASPPHIWPYLLGMHVHSCELSMLLATCINRGKSSVGRYGRDLWRPTGAF